MSKSAFDATALGYDAEFTLTQTGKYQRSLVWKELIALSVVDKKIVEMNCGTGEDAIFLTKQKGIVVATDISVEMIHVAKYKASRLGYDTIEFKPWDLSQKPPFEYEVKFDLAFSNFGGWNCLSSQEIVSLGEDLASILVENGRVCVVIMPSFCMWESVYFLMKGNINAAFRRRNREGVSARLNATQSVLTYYYSPRSIRKYLSRYFEVVKIRPIGFFVPPSYLDSFFRKITFLLPVLYLLEKGVGRIPFLAYFSDHYLMVLRKKES